MIKTVDKRDGLVVQKITKPDGFVVRYQIFREEHLGDSSKRVEAKTLTEARAHLGLPVPA